MCQNFRKKDARKYLNLDFAVQMDHVNKPEQNVYGYQWSLNNKLQSFRVTTEEANIPLETDSEAEFIAEHYYGYTKHKNKTYEYEVKHPVWNQKKVIDYNINVDFGLYIW